VKSTLIWYLIIITGLLQCTGHFWVISHIYYLKKMTPLPYILLINYVPINC